MQKTPDPVPSPAPFPRLSHYGAFRAHHYPGIPHHVTQRGHGCRQVFFGDGDYACCRHIPRKYGAAHGVAIWGWALMANHGHLILAPETEDSLCVARLQVHRACTGHIDAREPRSGHFRQARLGGVAIDPPRDRANGIELI